MLAHALPALFAIFTWWFGTAVVFVLDQLPRRHLRLIIAGSTVVALVAMVGITRMAEDLTIFSAYAGFTCGVLVWAWQEVLFLSGTLTGPNRAPLPADVVGWARFRAALNTILHHEIAILAVGALLFFLVWDAPNQVAAQTYLLLWVMRLSAKLNIFFGCRNLGEDMLPPHLAHLASYFRRRRMNAIFPLSILGGTAAVVLLAQAALGGDGFVVTAYTLLAAMMALAVIEHAFLMLPIALDGLWTWGRPQRPQSPTMPLRP